MKVLILGGTGAIGKSLVNIMSKHNIEIYVTTRQERKSIDNIKYIKGNAHDINFLKNTIANNRFKSNIYFYLLQEYIVMKINLLMKTQKDY